MKNFIKAFIVIFIIGACSKQRPTQEVVENIEPKEIENKPALTFEDKYIEPVVELEPIEEKPAEFDINSIEYDTLNLPIISISSAIKILTTGQFHEDEVWPDAINQTWIGLFKTDSTSYLKVIQPKFERIKDIILDEGEEKTGWKVTTGRGDKCILLMTGIDLNEGEIPTAKLNNTRPLPLDTVNLEMQKSNTKLIVDGINLNGYVANYKMKLLSYSNDEKEEQLIIAKRNFDDKMINIIWAGDIDGDGKVDLIIDTARHYNVMEPTLFLSSMAKGKSIIECVAIHRTLGG